MSQHISEDEFQKMLGAIELSHGEKGKAFVKKVEQVNYPALKGGACKSYAFRD